MNRSQTQPDVVYESQKSTSTSERSKKKLPVVTDIWNLAKPSSYKLPKSNIYQVIFEYDIGSGFFDEKNFTKLQKHALTLDFDIGIDVTINEVIKVMKDLNDQETVTNFLIEERNYKFSCFTFLLCIFLPIIGLVIAYFCASCENERIEVIIKERIKRIENFINNLNETTFKKKVWKWRFGKGASWIELVNTEKVKLDYLKSDVINGSIHKTFNSDSDNEGIKVNNHNKNSSPDVTRNNNVSNLDNCPGEFKVIHGNEKLDQECNEKNDNPKKITDGTYDTSLLSKSGKKDDNNVENQDDDNELSKTTEKIDITHKRDSKFGDKPGVNSKLKSERSNQELENVA